MFTSPYAVPPLGLEPDCADFKNARVGIRNQQKQVAEGEHFACTTPYLIVAGTAAVRAQIAPSRRGEPARDGLPIDTPDNELARRLQPLGASIQ
jgi:hypothetical protein